ncbi:acetyl-CoA decarbonylase/synthase complex subunit alpha/beta [Parasporobacterium paucivorans]|uniref:CO-methylating acetyl-CoA synthase n=1 Tax=Parasporobacterium paucivorans DSM 15970 TaxID=1122934 RepID=A0A1M6A8Y8_9FIRM|nr:acetyl-CoA decarbonylase/synthase complex subunit alpha/beta [Parasporobacterium paucivorans]SHI32917.1 acetyl-CoA decarbonylase/synthase beta subunit [Parasporobacterium paucivorans DSM 15970]
MSVLTDLIYGGSNAVAGLTEGAVNDAIAKYGADKKLAFPDTAYFFPTIYAATGVKVKTLGDLPACVGVLKSLITNKEDLGDALNAGLATAVGAEIIEGLKYVEGGDPYAQDSGIGFVPDPIIRSLGVPLVTGDIPGVAVVLGKAENPADVVAVVKDYQNKGIMTFLVGDLIEQAIDGGVKVGLDFRVVPLGHDVTSVIHAVTVAIRAALIFGNATPGDLAGLLAYTKERVPAFVNTFGPLDAVTVSAGAGAIALGFPVVVDVDLGENQVPGALESVTDHGQTVAKSLELRKIKIKMKEIPVPVAFASAFEGEIIRKNDMHAEFSSHKNPTCELVLSRGKDEITDHKVEVNGPDIDGSTAPVEMPIAILVEVFGEKMQPDFEPVIERKIHHWFNYMEGVMHTGQRNLLRIRIDKAAFEKGLRLKDLGEVIYYMVMDEFDNVVDKCQVTIYTEKDKVEEILSTIAMPTYGKRDERLESLNDETVDTFYTCILCQSFAPAHCCVVTPERTGLCGAVSWLDAKATKELTPTGPCQPIPKEGCLDELKGIYTEVNKIVEESTHGSVSNVTLYSILEDPMTSCGCFECICGIMPEANGVVIVNREHKGMTPTGMTFGELASMTGGGVQTPGFMGHGRSFISSKKFIRAEGGISRIVWMPKELKDAVADKLNKTAKELYGIDNFSDMICDETISEDSEGVLEFLTEKGHPALSSDPIM